MHFPQDLQSQRYNFWKTQRFILVDTYSSNNLFWPEPESRTNQALLLNSLLFTQSFFQSFVNSFLPFHIVLTMFPCFEINNLKAKCRKKT